MKTNLPISIAASGNNTSELSLETVGHHNAIVYYGDNGSKITLLEDAPHASAQHRLAYREMAKLIKEHETLEAVADSAKQMLAYIEMNLAHRGTMTVAQIVTELEHVKQVGSISTAHHVGCAVTTRSVNLAAARSALSTLEAMRKEEVQS